MVVCDKGAYKVLGANFLTIFLTENFRLISLKPANSCKLLFQVKKKSEETFYVPAFADEQLKLIERNVIYYNVT